MDVHQDFCEIAIAEDRQVRSVGRVKTPRPELELFAQSLAPDDHVALEATANALAIARLLEGHVGRVVVANTKKLRQISEAKAKTDRLNARTLARVLASGFLDVVCCPTRRRARCGAGSRGARSSSVSAPGPRTRFTPCWFAP